MTLQSTVIVSVQEPLTVSCLLAASVNRLYGWQSVLISMSMVQLGMLTLELHAATPAQAPDPVGVEVELVVVGELTGVVVVDPPCPMLLRMLSHSLLG